MPSRLLWLEVHLEKLERSVLCRVQELHCSYELSELEQRILSSSNLVLAASPMSTKRFVSSRTSHESLAALAVGWCPCLETMQ
jgi:hypothetical protein